MSALAVWVMPSIIVFIVATGLARGVSVFEAFLEGAAEGLRLLVRILPAIVGMLTVVGMLSASGATDVLVKGLEPLAKILNLPEEVMPLAVLRPVSGSGSLAIVKDLLTTYGPDSFVGRISSVMMGSTETTFYTIAIYFGSVGVHKTSYTVPVALTADLCSFGLAAMSIRILLP